MHLLLLLLLVVLHLLLVELLVVHVLYLGREKNAEGEPGLHGGKVLGEAGAAARRRGTAVDAQRRTCCMCCCCWCCCCCCMPPTGWCICGRPDIFEGSISEEQKRVWCLLFD